MQAWSPVLDVAQDARWGRCEETFGEDPVFGISNWRSLELRAISLKGLFTTPKHFEVMVHLWVDVIRTI